MNTTKISKNEYRVRLFIDEKYQAEADYFTDDLEDALATADHMQATGVPSERLDYDDYILTIARRAVVLAADQGHTLRQIDVMMALDACHENNPLHLERLAYATDGDLGHDIFGIWRHLDRATGTLDDCFLPRFSV